MVLGQFENIIGGTTEETPYSGNVDAEAVYNLASLITQYYSTPEDFFHDYKFIMLPEVKYTSQESTYNYIVYEFLNLLIAALDEAYPGYNTITNNDFYEYASQYFNNDSTDEETSVFFYFKAYPLIDEYGPAVDLFFSSIAKEQLDYDNYGGETFYSNFKIHPGDDYLYAFDEFNAILGEGDGIESRYIYSMITALYDSGTSFHIADFPNIFFYSKGINMDNSNCYTDPFWYTKVNNWYNITSDYGITIGGRARI